MNGLRRLSLGERVQPALGARIPRTWETRDLRYALSAWAHAMDVTQDEVAPFRYDGVPLIEIRSITHADALLSEWF